jgi:hypothetical protein
MLTYHYVHRNPIGDLVRYAYILKPNLNRHNIHIRWLCADAVPVAGYYCHVSTYFRFLCNEWLTARKYKSQTKRRKKSGLSERSATSKRSSNSSSSSSSRKAKGLRSRRKEGSTAALAVKDYNRKNKNKNSKSSSSNNGWFSGNDTNESKSFFSSLFMTRKPKRRTSGRTQSSDPSL